MVDRDLVLRKIADVDQYLQQLADYRQIDLDSYQHDWKTQRIIERILHLTSAPRSRAPAIILRVLRTDLADVARFREAILRAI